MLERSQVLDIISAVRQRALAEANTYRGSGSEGPNAHGRRDACDEIWRAIQAIPDAPQATE